MYVRKMIGNRYELKQNEKELLEIEVEELYKEACKLLEE